MQKGISQVFRMNSIIYQRDLKYGVLLSVAGGLQKKKGKVISCAFILEEDNLSCVNVRPFLCSL